MVRLVKGAYWDSEIKRTQVEGLADYPLFTRKAATDVSYLAVAKDMLAAENIRPAKRIPRGLRGGGIAGGVVDGNGGGLGHGSDAKADVER